jgi:zinc/manganese transport system substrate-binding protein
VSREQARAAVPARPRAAMVALVTMALVTAALVTAGCAAPAGGAAGARPGVIQVVAAENVWGSIASQLGGRYVHVTSIIANPGADPHSYEPTAADARAIASAQMVIENGIGYDPWVPRLLSADQPLPVVLDVGTLLKVPPGGNPHRWYDPAGVRAVIGAVTAGYARLAPRHRAYFAARKTWFTTVALKRYHALIAAIRARYAGTPVGASESIFAMMAPALGLRLVTPYSFLKAVSEGGEVPAAGKQAADRQIARHLIRIYVYNSQNLVPDVQAQLAQARARHIPVTTLTETLVPAGVTFQAWQDRQLAGIEAALARSAHASVMGR